jgi:hypothetical protein
MKLLRFFLVAVSMLALTFCDGYDDSELVKRIENLEGKVDFLQHQVAGINGEIDALKISLAALESEDVVIGMRAITDNGKAGWEITYRKSGTVKIFPLEGTEDRIGVRDIDGILYWTWGGSLLLDNNGKRIPASAVNGKDGSDGADGNTPVLKIENGYWMVSYDKGVSWTRLEKAATEASSSSSLFRSANVVDGNLVLVLSNGTKLTIPFSSMEKPTDFDENCVVLSVAAISDVHIGNGYGSEAKFTSALQQLKNRAAEQDRDGLDAVMIVGDLVDAPSTSQITTLKNLYEGVFDPVKVPMIYTIGNHDMNSGYSWDATTVSRNAAFRDILGDDYFLTDLDQTMRLNFECRHCVVGNYHIICITPNGTSPVVYDVNTTTWLDRTLKEITENDPEHYVMLLTHPMIYNTVYGSTLGTYWYTSALTDVLNNYPQVITFGGHLHFPLNDPRSIWQGKFTSMGCASVSYMAFEGGDYINKKSNTVLNDAGEYSEGLLIQFDANGFMRATRMDFYRSTVIGKPWTIYPPAGDNSHLDTYNHAALQSVNSAPALSTLEIECGTVSNNAAPVEARWAAGTDDEFVHHYSYKLTKDGTTVASKLIMSDFYRSPQTSMMKSEYSLSLGNLEVGTYILTIVAYDSWDLASTPLTREFTVGADSESKWTGDAAGSAEVSGGTGNVNGTWVNYTSGTISWTANTTGKPRKETITLPNGKQYTVKQLDASDFKGTWSFRTQRFSNNTSVTSAANDITFDVTLTDALYGETLADVDSRQYTNNLGLRGLYLDAVADVSVRVDYENNHVDFGLFLDERKAQAVSNGNSTYPYVCFIPELGASSTAFTSPWSFVPVPVGTNNNYTWLWFDVSEDFNTLNYDCPLQKLTTANSYASSPYIIGITCAVCKNANPAAGDISSTYDVIYQANPNKVTTNGGFTLKRK